MCGIDQYVAGEWRDGRRHAGEGGRATVQPCRPPVAALVERRDDICFKSGHRYLPDYLDAKQLEGWGKADAADADQRFEYREWTALGCIDDRRALVMPTSLRKQAALAVQRRKVRDAPEQQVLQAKKPWRICST